ncbi:unnamed protein product [Alternaria sp. RS040]
MSSYDIHLSVNGAERRERHRVTNRDRAVWERNRSRDEKLDSRNWRERMRLNHGTPESNGKNPKRQLFGPPTEPRASTEMVSPTPSKTTNLDDDIENVNRATSSYSPSVGRTTRRKLVMVRSVREQAMSELMSGEGKQEVRHLLPGDGKAI